MSQPPLVTIITPAYNRADLVAETIESVLNQDYPNLEYIVLDDGSTDETLAVIKQYDGRLRWESHPNMGETRTVNKGFELARGEIIGVVNSDDPLLPGAVAKLVAALIEHPEVVVVYPDWQLIDARGQIRQVVHCRDFVSHIEMIRGHHCLPGPGAFFRKIVVEKTEGRDPNFRFVGDLDFWFRAGFSGEFKRIPQTLATFRVHSGSTSVNSQCKKMADEHIAVVEKFFSQHDLAGYYNRNKKESFLNGYHAAICSCGKYNFIYKFRNILNSLCSDPFLFIVKYKYRIIIYTFLLFGFNYNYIENMFKSLKVFYFRKSTNE